MLFNSYSMINDTFGQVNVCDIMSNTQNTASLVHILFPAIQTCTQYAVLDTQQALYPGSFPCTRKILGMRLNDNGPLRVIK